MHLEKLEIQGFKSFANKNRLVFPGILSGTQRGITAIVGPNGSGKSNVADAVRWALGEQSMKTLRGKKAQDIIFSGSDKKGSLGMSEVSLHLNNEDKQAPLDYSQIVVTRRLYRNGDSEYMINNNRVRLSDIQMMLAKAKFGQKTYSVIGQGMVEGFLNTSLSERKEFFDEATGVKQYQIKRDESLSKLHSSYENLIQAQMLLKEIEPRLRSLTRQVNRLRKRGEIESELKDLQLRYYSTLWHDINNNFKDYNKKFLEQEKVKFDLDKKLAGLNNKLAKIEEESQETNDFVAFQEELNQAQQLKDDITTKLSKLEAQLEMKLEASGKFDLSFLINKREELEREIDTIEEEIESQKQKIMVHEEHDEELKNRKAQIDIELNKVNAKLASVGNEAQEVGQFKDKLRAILKEIKNVDQEAEVEKIKKIVSKVRAKLEEILAQGNAPSELESGTKDGQWHDIHERVKNLSQQKEEQLTKINENKLRISARSERVKLLQEKINDLKGEIEAIEEKIKKNSGEIDIEDLSQKHKELKQKLHDQQAVIKDINEKIHRLNINEERKRNELFSLQREISNLQSEINKTNSGLSEIKINSTRFETKLEDLEIEIREELKGLKEVKETKNKEPLNVEESRAKISQLKRQLELIGGIDPQIESEYNETKERYDFLAGQVNDFTKAVSSLEKIIKELDLIIKEQFDKEFKLIANNFEKYFKILFNGGHAKIIKIMETQSPETTEDQEEDEEGVENGDKPKPKKEDLGIADLKKIKFLQKHNATGLAGIEIQATPPGKKIKTVTMLSGGERAMTAIALICAIISSNPSPFVVLDEVDAALDEANSERLAKILDELSHKTQFIVVTHNRATMRRANILYGITMGDDGVSKLLSIKLDEASKHLNK